MQQPKLSIIICAHNAAPYIAECIASLCLADHPDWEAIVVNDASTDKTPDIVGAFAKKHANLHCHSLTHNVGPGNARNLALMLLAKGEYIAFVDADDYIDAATLAGKINTAADSGTDVLISGHFRLYDHGLSLKAIEAGEFSGPTGACLYLTRTFRTWGACMTLYRRDHLLRNRCLFVPWHYYEDVVFCFHALHAALKVVAEPAPYYTYRCNNVGITKGKTATPLHLMSSARLYFDLVTMLRTKPESDLLQAAFTKACDILVSEHLPRMVPPLRQGLHTTSSEFFRTFMYYIGCCDTPFSRAVFQVIQKNMPENEADAKINETIKKRLAYRLFCTLINPHLNKQNKKELRDNPARFFRGAKHPALRFGGWILSRNLF